MLTMGEQMVGHSSGTRTRAAKVRGAGLAREAGNDTALDVDRTREISRRIDEVDGRLEAQREALGRTYRASWEADRRSRRAGEKAEAAMSRAADATCLSRASLVRSNETIERLGDLERRVRQTEREGRLAAYDRAQACRRMDASAAACAVICVVAMLVTPFVDGNWPWLLAVTGISSAAAIALTSDAIDSGPRKRAQARARETGRAKGARK